MWLFAGSPQNQVRGLIGTVRHVLGRQVRQLGQDLVDRRAQPGGLGGCLSLGLPVLEALAQQWCRVFAALLGGSYLARDAITSRLRLLRAGFGGAPVAVEREYLLRPRQQTTSGQATVEFFRV